MKKTNSKPLDRQQDDVPWQPFPLYIMVGLQFALPATLGCLSPLNCCLTTPNQLEAPLTVGTQTLNEP